MHRTGIVSQVDAATHRVRVRWPAQDNVESQWLAVAVPAAFEARSFALPRVGEQVVALLDERAEDGVVVGSVYSAADPPPAVGPTVRRAEWPDGAAVEYDPTTQRMRITLPAGGTLELAGAASAIALATRVESELAAIQTALDSHTHPAGALVAPPLGGPVTGMTGAASAGYSPAAVGSAQVKSA